MTVYRQHLVKMAIGWMLVTFGLLAWTDVAPTQRAGQPITRMEPLTPYVPAPPTWTPTLP